LAGSRGDVRRREPRAFLAGAREALRPGGALAVSTPFHGRTKAVAIGLLAFERHFDPDGDHVRFFTDRTLRRMLLETGFDDVEVVHLGRFAPLWANTWAWARAS
jgi:hypothetical protein